MTTDPPTSPRDELKALLRAKIAEVLNVEFEDWAAEEIMRLFYVVEDDWDRTYVTTMGDPDDRWIDHRYLLARVLVQTVHGERRVERKGATRE